MKMLLFVLVLALALLILSVKTASAQEIEVQPREIEPNGNLRVYPFYDKDKSYKLEPGEGFLPATGVIRWEGGENEWEALETPALIYVPNGVQMIMDTVPEADDLFICPQVTGPMPDSGSAYAELPCWSTSPVSFLYDLWISLLRRHR